MNGHEQLGEFLRGRRSQVRPDDIGLPTYGELRRVPGLRREELAQLAGVSASYYTRLEQGQSLNASPEVLEAIARALRLDEHEQRHLFDLAGARRRPGRARRPAAERVSAATAELLGALGDMPAILLGRRSDVLAWNRMGHALFAGHLDPAGPSLPGGRPNMARLVFLDAHTRELYPDWAAKAKAVVGSLRVAVGEYPDDAALQALVGELTTKSTEFATLWAGQRVKGSEAAVYEMRHPLVGTLTVTQQTLGPRQDRGQHLVLATAAPGSASETALTLLAQALHTRADTAGPQSARADRAGTPDTSAHAAHRTSGPAA